MPGRRPGRMRWPAPNSPFNSFVLFGVAGLLRARLESGASLGGGSSSIRSCFGEWRSGLKNLYKQLRTLCRLLVQEPVCGIGEGEEFAMSAIAQAFASHFWDQEFVTLAPQDARGHAHGGVGETRAIAQGRAIPVDHRGEGARLRPSGTVDRKSTRLNSSHGYISYAVFCLKKKKNKKALQVASERCLQCISRCTIRTQQR